VDKDHIRSEERIDAMESITLAYLCVSLPLALCLSLSSSRRFVGATDMATVRNQEGLGLGFPKGYRYPGTRKRGILFFPPAPRPLGGSF